MRSEREARRILMAVCEPGLVHIGESMKRFGAVETLERLKCGHFAQVAIAATRSMGELDETALVKEWESAGAQLVIPGDPNWPPSLDELVIPPIGLAIQGSADLSASAKSIAIVGARAASAYGVRVAEEFASSLVDRGFAVVSGGAFGIDAAAHRGALAANGVTMAVLASGVCELYPRANTRLFELIAESGLLISEVRPRAQAMKSRFLVRNRVIAALSQGTLVVEAAFRSGSLRTALDAVELHRYVMGIPGPITSPTSAGVHRLIAENVVTLVSSVEDIVNLVSPLMSETVSHPLMSFLSRRQGITAAELAHLGAMEISVAFAALGELVVLGAVVRDSRGAFLLAPA